MSHSMMSLGNQGTSSEGALNSVETGYKYSNGDTIVYIRARTKLWDELTQENGKPKKSSVLGGMLKSIARPWGYDYVLTDKALATIEHLKGVEEGLSSDGLKEVYNQYKYGSLKSSNVKTRR